MMRSLIAIILPISLVACGPSQEEIDNIAIVTCNVMGESRNMDAAFRIKEINAAREKIGQEPFLGSDDSIKYSIAYGSCEALVKNDDATYYDLLKTAKELDAQRNRISEQKAAEERLAEEQIAEQRRQEKAAEERRVLDERLKVAIAEYGWDCPISQEELDQISEKSWEEGKTELYQAAMLCFRSK